MRNLRTVESQRIESETHYRTLFNDNLSNILLVNPKTGMIEDANQAATNFYGWPHDELCRKSIFEINTLGVEQIKAKMTEVFSEKQNRFEFNHRLSNGEVRDVEVFAGPIKFKDKTMIYAHVQDITEQKRVREIIQKQEERYRTTLDQMLEGCQIIGFDWKYLYLNHTAQRHNRRPNAELLGQRYMDAWPGIKDTSIFNIIKRTLEEKVPAHLEYRFVFPDGTFGWFDLSIQPVTEGVFILSIDITERKQAEDEILHLNERIARATRSAQVGIWDWDIQQNLLTWDDQMYALYGLKKDGFSGAFEAWVSGLHPDDREFAQNAVNLALSGEKRYDVEFRVVWPDDTIHYLKARGEVLSNDLQEPTRMVGVNFDITDRKKTEEEVIKLNETLEYRVMERTAQLELANKELEAFSYSVSHDLRAPLRHINGYVDLLSDLLQDNLSEKAQHYMSTITNSTNQMGKLIDDLLEFSRTGRQELKKTKFDMGALVGEVIEKLEPDTKNRIIQWTVQKLPEIFGDFSLLKQVWVNLMGNAIKYSRNKPVAEIYIAFKEEKRNFIFSIRDNGVGFDMKYAHKLFGVFHRLHSQSEFEGTGIGLANVQRIVHKHNGRVWVEAETDKGATFFFSLPKILENEQ